MTPTSALTALVAAIVGTVGGCVLGWRLRGGAPVRHAGAVVARVFLPVPELVVAIEAAALREAPRPPPDTSWLS